MGKLLLFLSLVCISIVGIGTVLFPNNAMFWLASSDNAYQQVRIVLGSLVVIQLVTRPPRHVWFRVLAGAFAFTVGIWSVQQTYLYHMEFLDTLAFLGAAFAVFATALERRTSSDLTLIPSSNGNVLSIE